MEPKPPFLPEAGADPIWSELEPESAPVTRTGTSGAGAAQKRGGSAALVYVQKASVSHPSSFYTDPDPA